MKYFSFKFMKDILIKGVIISLVMIIGCMSNNTGTVNNNVVKPLVVTEKVKYDTDDPAIWINPDDPAQSLILGTDKDADGALYVYDLNGKIIEDQNVDIIMDKEYVLQVGKRRFLKIKPIR